MAHLSKRLSKSRSQKAKRRIFLYRVKYLKPGDSSPNYSYLSTGTTDARTAKAICEKVARTLEQGIPFEVEERDITELARQWIKARTRKVSEDTAAFYELTLGIILNGVPEKGVEGWGSRPTSDWTRDNWVTWLAHGIEACDWTRSTCQKRSTTMGQFVGWLREHSELDIEEGMAKDSLKAAGERAGGYPISKRKLKGLTWILVRQLATHLRLMITQPTSAKYGTAVALALLAGLRRKELKRARWEHIDLDGDAPSITVDGKRGERTVDLREPLLDILRQVRKDSGWVCPQLQLIDLDNTRTGLDTLLGHAGCPGIGWHELRHTFCYWLWALRIDPDDIKEQMGHVDLTTTSKYMGARWPEKRRFGAEYFDEVFLTDAQIHDLEKARAKRDASRKAAAS